MALGYSSCLLHEELLKLEHALVPGFTSTLFADLFPCNLTGGECGLGIVALAGHVSDV